MFWALEARFLHFIVSASRSPPGLDSKGSTFGAHLRLAPKRVDFWSSFSHSWGSLALFFGHFSSLGRTLGALGAHFLITKTVWATKGATRGKTPDKKSLFGYHFGVIFWVFFDFWGSVFKRRFLLSSETDFPWIVASFRHNFLILFCTCRHLWF